GVRVQLAVHGLLEGGDGLVQPVVRVVRPGGNLTPVGRSRAPCLFGRFPDSPLRTGRARFPRIRLSRARRSSLMITHGSVSLLISPGIAATSCRTRLISFGLPCPWCPSPCGRLSRPPTTMAPPTPPRFHRPICRAPFQGGLPRSRRWT